MKKIRQSRAFLSIFFATIVFIVIYIISLTSAFNGINEAINTIGITTKNYAKKDIVDENIVVITIDEKTLDKLGSFPFSRDYYGKLINNLNLGGASVIGFDLIFSDENKYNPESDKIFSDSIKKAGNIVLGGSIIQKVIENKPLTVLEKPLKIFDDYKYSFGYFTPIISKSGTVISFVPSMKLSDEKLVVDNYNHFTISLLKAYYGKIYNKNFNLDYGRDDDFFYIREGVGIPFSKTGGKEILINYIPLPDNNSGSISKFTNYSFIDVIEGKVDYSNFEGKIIIVGATAKGIKDTFYTRNGIEYGVFVHANIINTILKKDFLYYFPENLEWILVYLLIITSIYFSLSPAGKIIFYSNISIAFGFLVIYPLVGLVFFSYTFSHIFELFISLPFSIAIGNAIKYIYENNNKYKLSKALSEYVSKAIVKEILSNSGDIKLDGDTKKLSIFFSDIEGFTNISEKFSAKELVSFLRHYLTDMSNIILDNNGFINKYEGDAIMALWGAFSENKDDSYNACLSAINQQNTLKLLNNQWKEKGLPEIKVRIGLHCGTAIVGNIGAVGRKIEYTALGDSVNLASRLEGVNKFYGTFICVSEDIYNENKDKFEFRYLDKIIVKGKEKPIKIYELICEKDRLTENQKNILNEFSLAMNLYFSRDFSSAKTKFKEIYDKYFDSPSKTYMDRCNYFIDNKPLNSEELIWKFDTK